MKPTAIILGPDRQLEIERAQLDAFAAFRKGHQQAGLAYLITAIDLLNQARGRV